MKAQPLESISILLKAFQRIENRDSHNNKKVVATELVDLKWITNWNTVSKAVKEILISSPKTTKPVLATKRSTSAQPLANKVVASDKKIGQFNPNFQ